MTWQMEAVVIHVNEGGALTRGINLLNQLRLTADIRLGRCCSLFAGPVVNLMVSDQFDPDSGEYGSKLLPTSTFYDELSSGSKTRRVTGWLSFQGGLRF